MGAGGGGLEITVTQNILTHILVLKYLKTDKKLSFGNCPSVDQMYMLSVVDQGTDLLFGVICAENCMKMKEIGLREGCESLAPLPLDPPMVINFYVFEAEIQSTINNQYQYYLGADESEAPRRKQEDEKADDLRQIRRQCK